MGPDQARARVAQVIRDARSVFLVAHENPDADAVGSLLALRSMLRRLGKAVHAATPDPPSDRFGFLADFDALTSAPPSRPPDLAIALDCDGASRLGELQEAFLGAPLTVDIDHHQGVAPFGDIRWIVPNAAATAVLVAELGRELGLQPTPQEASALYAGLIADTGGFRFSNTTPQALRLGAELIAAGADPAELARRVFSARPLAAALLQARALASLEMAAEGILLATLTCEDFAQTHAAPGATDGLIDSFRDVEGVRVAALLKESEPGTWQVSLRGNAVDVASVAARFGGGGHREAAGFTIEGGADEVRVALLQALTPALAKEPRNA
ncbi:MAG: bifunctional oligoribonuclease/PAP phosphatase NrnA [Armatimonadota bacterium]